MQVGTEKKKGIMVEMNVTPLTDVFLVLLIFFMVTTSFILTAQGITINLPTAANIETIKQKDLTISMDINEQIFLNEERVTYDTLQGKIQDRLEGKTEKLVVIKADKDVYTRKVVKLMDIAKQAGAEKLAISTEIEEK